MTEEKTPPSNIENSEEDKQEGSEEQEEPEKEYGRPFNPMKTYIQIAIAIFISYSVLYILGYEFLLMIMLFFLVSILRDTIFVLQTYDHGFARKAAIFNAFHSTAWFLVLAINGYFIILGQTPLILPSIPNLTELAPLFVLMAAFGSKNLMDMYAPKEKPRYSWS